MKVLERGVTPDGVKIQIEDWSEDYPGIHSYGDFVAAYPKTPAGYSYRAELHLASCEEAGAVFGKLEAGDSILDDYKFTSHKSGRTIPFREFRFQY